MVGVSQGRIEDGRFGLYGKRASVENGPWCLPLLSSDVTVWTDLDSGGCRRFRIWNVKDRGSG